MIKEIFEDLEEEKVYKAYENILTSSKEEGEKTEMGKVLIIRENGIIRIAKFEELDKKQWYMIQTDKTNEFSFIDYDINSVKPIVKSILNEVANFPEIIILKQIRITAIVILVFAMLATFLSYNSLKQKDAVELNKKLLEGIQSREVIKTLPGSNSGTIVDDNF